MAELLIEDLVFVGIVATLHAWQLGQAATEVVTLRRKHKIMPPVMEGPPDLMRAFRAQQNCLEFGIVFQIVLWTAAIFCHQVPAAVFGLVYLYGRHKYIKGYIQNADKRIPGFWMSIHALKGLIGAAMLGFIHVMLKHYAGIDIAVMLMNKIRS